ncbi:hypothetical protein [Aeoliella sp.]|uniref:hypothetical protein n=1 Tax=Aeoliella sp. TaxID=2795800 RepID=UPI003CCBE110
MTQTNKPVSEMYLVGSVAYQLYSNVFRGRVQYYGKIGKPVIDRQTGESSILPWMMDNGTRDYIAACEIVARELEGLRNAAFRQDVQHSAATVSPATGGSEAVSSRGAPIPLKLAST